MSAGGGNVDAGTHGGGKGLVHQIDLPGSGAHGGLHYGSGLHRGDGRGNAYGDPGLDEEAAGHLPDKFLDQIFGEQMIGNDAVPDRAFRLNVCGGLAQHGQSFMTDCHDLLRADVVGDNAGFFQNDAFPPAVNDDFCGTQIDTEIHSCQNDSSFGNEARLIILQNACGSNGFFRFFHRERPAS